jgi:hypothetical protein
MDIHTAIFLLVSDADLATETVNKKLETIANTEDRDSIGLSPLKETVGKGRGVGDVDGVGTTRENDDGGIEVGDGLKRGSAVETEGENGKASDSTSDEMSVLRTEIEDKN